MPGSRLETQENSVHQLRMRLTQTSYNLGLLIPTIDLTSALAANVNICPRTIHKFPVPDLGLLSYASCRMRCRDIASKLSPSSILIYLMIYQFTFWVKTGLLNSL